MLDRRLVLFTGKGGAGRSALAASMALRAARDGRKVLLVAMTDGLGAAEHLTLDSLDYRPHEVRPGLWAMAVDPATSLEEYLRLQLHVPSIGPATRALGVLADTVPGVRDTVVIGKVIYEAARGGWDLVVADGPPTGQIGSYITAPATIQGLVPSGRVQRQAGWMRDLLEDPAATAIVVVSLAEELPVSETAEARVELTAAGLLPATTVLVNRVLPDDLPPRSVPKGAGMAREAALLHRSLVAAQAVWLDRLDADLMMPYLFGLHTPAEVAARLADEWPLR